MEGPELLAPTRGVKGRPGLRAFGLRAFAQAGNALALVLLILILARREALFQESPAPAASPRHGPAPAARVLVVVIDALRADQVDRMPHLAALARNGGRGTARVEALLPSTIAGIRALAEGLEPPPASFTEDFGTSRVRSGGIFAAVATSGRTSFAAGPRLWGDLYGPWLTAVVEVTTIRGDDARAWRAAQAALPRHDLVVVHLGAPDDAAHAAGAGSSAYAEAVRRCDTALGELLRAAPPGTAVLVTADHGVNDRGGHAGPEPSVLEVPVVVYGPGLPVGNLGTWRQSDLHRLILQPLGLALAPVEPSTPAASWWKLLPAFMALGATLVIWSAVAAGRENPRESFVLSAALWCALALCFLHPVLGLGLALAVLVWMAWRSAGAPQANRVRSLFLLAAAFAALRLFDALRSLADPLPLPPPVGLLAVALVGVAAGAGLRKAPGLLQGFAAAALPVLLARFILGETASLSTLDVRAAFDLVEGPLGMMGAAGAAFLRQTFPFLAVLLGLLARPPRESIGFEAGLAAGLGATLAGQAAVAVLLLGPGMDQPLASLGLGLLVRLLGESTALFLGGAGLLAAGALTRRS